MRQKGFSLLIVLFSVAIITAVLVVAYFSSTGIVKLPTNHQELEDEGWGVHFQEVSEHNVSNIDEKSYLGEDERKSYLSKVSFVTPGSMNKIDCEYATYIDSAETNCDGQANDYAITLSFNDLNILNNLGLTGGTESTIGGRRAVQYNKLTVIYYSDTVLLFVGLNSDETLAQYNALVQSLKFES